MAHSTFHFCEVWFQLDGLTLALKRLRKSLGCYDGVMDFEDHIDLSGGRRATTIGDGYLISSVFRWVNKWMGNFRSRIPIKIEGLMATSRVNGQRDTSSRAGQFVDVDTFV